MKLVEEQPIVSESLKAGSGNRASEGAERPEAHVVEHDHNDVRRPCWGGSTFEA
jgi:hypothetical protein